jgi:hypothetical protein
MIFFSSAYNQSQSLNAPIIKQMPKRKTTIDNIFPNILGLFFIQFSNLKSSF